MCQQNGNNFGRRSKEAFLIMNIFTSCFLCKYSVHKSVHIIVPSSALRCILCETYCVWLNKAEQHLILSQSSGPAVKQTPDDSSLSSPPVFETWLNLTAADKEHLRWWNTADYKATPWSYHSVWTHKSLETCRCFFALELWCVWGLSLTSSDKLKVATKEVRIWNNGALGYVESSGNAFIH